MITIQPQTLPDLTRPYPFHIDPDTGDVARQDFWKGDPYRLLGFQAQADVQRVNLHLHDFSNNPQKAVGMYPVFLRENGTMYSSGTSIETVTVQDD